MVFGLIAWDIYSYNIMIPYKKCTKIYENGFNIIGTKPTPAVRILKHYTCFSCEETIICERRDRLFSPN